MAKANKTPTTPAGAAAPASSAAKKKLPAKAKVAPVVGTPMVNTTLAAQAAAKGLVAGLTTANPAVATGKESASFRQLKDSLAHPAASGIDSMLDKTALPNSRKPNTPFAGNKSVGGSGRNQTFGADVNRSGVPRRTSGG